MGPEFIIGVLAVTLWFFIGTGLSYIIEEEFENMNPLWRIPITLAGFFSLGVLIIIWIVRATKSYIKEVKDYYKRKRKHKKKNKDLYYIQNMLDRCRVKEREE
jgi:hydrogenase maturation factor